MRLDKFVCKCTELTRSEAIQRIHAGAVCINGDVTTIESVQVHENNSVTFENRKLIARPYRYLLMHKPSGTVCSNIDEHYPSLFNYLDIDRPSELHIAGRLDADTTGLVLLTDDGHWSYNITVPNKQCSKTYRVALSRAVLPDVAHLFAQGIQLQGEARHTLPAVLVLLNEKEVLLTLTEGRFHQVKRMFAAVGNRVVTLHRERIGEVILDVDAGHWRYLAPHEVQSFFQ